MIRHTKDGLVTVFPGPGVERINVFLVTVDRVAEEGTKRDEGVVMEDLRVVGNVWGVKRFIKQYAQDRWEKLKFKWENNTTYVSDSTNNPSLVLSYNRLKLTGSDDSGINYIVFPEENEADMLRGGGR